jgi:hypothetical protein
MHLHNLINKSFKNLSIIPERSQRTKIIQIGNNRPGGSACPYQEKISGRDGMGYSCVPDSLPDRLQEQPTLSGKC